MHTNVIFFAPAARENQGCFEVFLIGNLHFRGQNAPKAPENFAIFGLILGAETFKNNQNLRESLQVLNTPLVFTRF